MEYYKKWGQSQLLMVLPEVVIDEIISSQKEILKLLKAQTTEVTNSWITEQQAQQIIGKKATSLWSLRKQGKLTFTKIGNKTFYLKESIYVLLEKNSKN